MTTRLWTPRTRFALSIVLFGLFSLLSHLHHDTTRLHPIAFWLAMSAMCALCLYLTEHASDRFEQRVGIFASWFLLSIAALGAPTYLFGWQHVVPRDVLRTLS